MIKITANHYPTQSELEEMQDDALKMLFEKYKHLIMADSWFLLEKMMEENQIDEETYWYMVRIELEYFKRFVKTIILYPENNI